MATKQRQASRPPRVQKKFLFALLYKVYININVSNETSPTLPNSD